jgi:hypothetical protein
MNARTVFAMLVAVALSGSSFAETKSMESAERELSTETTSASLLQAASLTATDGATGRLLGSPDFRNAGMTDRVFEEPSSPAFKVLGVTMFAVSAADFASTDRALSHPGVYEANPVQGNRNVRLLSHVAVPAFMYFVTEKLEDNGKPKLALIARIGFNVAYSYVVMHNLRTAALAP